MNDVMLITGANKGIGYSMASTWLAQGNIAIVLDISCAGIDILKNKYGDRLMTMVCDISDYNSVVESIEAAIQKYKYINIAVHNACVCVYLRVYPNIRLTNTKESLKSILMGQSTLQK